MITFLWLLLNPSMPNKHPPKEREKISVILLNSLCSYLLPVSIRCSRVQVICGITEQASYRERS